MHPRTKAIMIRAAAVEKGEKTYFTGQPCSKGHVASRRTLDSLCLECYTMKNQNKKRSEEDVVRKNNLAKLHYWAEQIKNLPQEDREKMGLFTADVPKQTKVSSAASMAITKVMLATEIMQRARGTSLDAGRIANHIIRLFDAEDEWWHKMTTRPVNEVLAEVMQHVEQEETEYFTRGSEYAAEHNLHSTRGTLGHVY